MTLEASRNRRRYGVSHIQNYSLGITETITYKMKGGNSVVIDLITNAQDFITHGDLSNARQTLNVARHLLSEINSGKLVGIVKRKGALKE